MPDREGSSKEGGSLSSNPPSLLPCLFSPPPSLSPSPFPLPHFPSLAYFWLGSFLSKQKCPANNSRLPYPSDPVTVSTERISVFLTDGLVKGLSLALQIPLAIIISQLPSVDHDFGWWLSVFGSLGCQVISFQFDRRIKGEQWRARVCVCSL